MISRQDHRIVLTTCPSFAWLDYLRASRAINNTSAEPSLSRRRPRRESSRSEETWASKMGKVSTSPACLKKGVEVFKLRVADFGSLPGTSSARLKIKMMQKRLQWSRLLACIRMLSWYRDGKYSTLVCRRDRRAALRHARVKSTCTPMSPVSTHMLTCTIAHGYVHVYT